MTNTSTKFEMVAKTFHGLENVLAAELDELGAENIEVETRAVKYEGDQELLYKSNFALRTAVKVLKPILKFNAKNDVELYKSVDQIDWTTFLSRGDTLSIDSTINSEHFNHSQFVSQKIKDAIVDQLRKSTGRRPSVDTQNPTLRLNFHVNGDDCSLALDSSGDSLHKRGYRIDGHVAPLNEVLAAGMIMLTGWNGNSDFYDLMCGSGTILIEAAMIAHNIKPGVFRSNYAFEKWKDFDMDLFEMVYDQFEEKPFDHSIYGSDYSAKTISLARTNIKNAMLDKRIQITTKSFFDYRFDQGGTLVMNPPYGERMGSNNLNSFYKRIGDKLKKDFINWHAWLISSNKEALKNVGLRTSKRYTLYNGNLECKFNKYELYPGSKKKKKTLQHHKSAG